MSFFDSASDLWNGASSAVSDFFGGGQKDEGPITVPVTPEQEQAAAAWVAESQRMSADPEHRSPYQQQQDRLAVDGMVNDSKRQAADPTAQYNRALDAYLAGKGPNPGPKQQYQSPYADMY